MNGNFCRISSIWRDGYTARHVIFILCHAVDPHGALAAAAGNDTVDGQCRVFRDFLLLLNIELAQTIKILPPLRCEEQPAELLGSFLGSGRLTKQGSEHEDAQKPRASWARCCPESRNIHRTVPPLGLLSISCSVIHSIWQSACNWAAVPFSAPPRGRRVTAHFRT